MFRLMSFGILLAAFTATGLKAATTTVCKKGTIERKIEIKFADGEKKLPCEVKYFKEGDEAGKTLWTAQNDAGYCEQKAKEFADKLVSTQGFDCGGAKATETTEETKPN